MNAKLEGIWEHMCDLEFAAYYDPENPRWSELSILQANVQRFIILIHTAHGNAALMRISTE